MTSQNELSQVVDAIRNQIHTQSVLDLLERMIDFGDASQLISAVIAKEQTAQPTKDAALSNTLKKLESLGWVSQPFACILMMHLWSNLDETYLHDVADRIDLWIDDCKSEKISNYLKHINESDDTNAQDMRDHFEAIIQAARERDQK